MAETAVERLNKKRIALFNERETEWDAHWKELQQYIQPRLGRFDLSETNRGKRLQGSIIDATAQRALRVLRSGMASGVSSPARPWFRLVTPDPEMMEFGPVKVWLYEVENRMRMIFSGSNVYQVLPMIYEEVGLFGTSVAFWLDDFNKVINGLPVTVGEYACAVGPGQTIDTVYRRYKPTVEQIVGFFSEPGDNIPPSVTQAYDRGDYYKRFPVYHAIEPRAVRDPGKLDKLNKAWKSVYWTDGVVRPIREGGFDDKPFTATRWDVTGVDTYGRSPGMEALGDSRQIQLQERRKAQFIEKMVSPPMVANGVVKNGFATVLAGGVTHMDGQSGARSGFEPAYQVNPQGYNALLQDMGEVRQRINSAFYADLFLMVSNMPMGGEKATATEIAVRQEEKMLTLGPVLERVHGELLNPLVDRAFSAMLKAGLVPLPPPELFGVDLRVDYISVLAQAQKAVATTGVERLVGFVTTLAQGYPNVLDKFDAEQAVDEYGDMLGVPPRIVRSDDDVGVLRQQRQQQEQALQAAAAVQQGAETAKTLSETDMSEGNALAAMMGRG